jgi:hypothetical protein
MEITLIPKPEFEKSSIIEKTAPHPPTNNAISTRKTIPRILMVYPFDAKSEALRRAFAASSR